MIMIIIMIIITTTFIIIIINLTSQLGVIQLEAVQWVGAVQQHMFFGMDWLQLF